MQQANVAAASDRREVTLTMVPATIRRYFTMPSRRMIR
jgi:hypothetical protein